MKYENALEMVARGVNAITNYINSEYLVKSNPRPRNSDEIDACEGVALVLQDMKEDPEGYAPQKDNINDLLDKVYEDPIISKAFFSMLPSHIKLVDEESALDLVVEGIDILTDYVYFEYLAKADPRPMNPKEQAVLYRLLPIVHDDMGSYDPWNAEAIRGLLDKTFEDPIFTKALIAINHKDQTGESLSEEEILNIYNQSRPKEVEVSEPYQKSKPKSRFPKLSKLYHKLEAYAQRLEYENRFPDQRP